MPRRCIFCGEGAGSREHVWPDWVLKLVPEPEGLRIKIGDSPAKIINGKEFIVKTVCGGCNKGWMSDLETSVSPTLGKMIQGTPVSLTPLEQVDITAWVIKIAMLLDSTGVFEKGMFYEQAERDQLRVTRAIPSLTTVWFGSFEISSLHVEGTAFRGNDDRGHWITHNSATTLVVGHVVFQVFTIHLLPHYQNTSLNFEPIQGPWNGLLIPIWPLTVARSWPPRFSFRNDRSMLSVGWVQGRWKAGKKVPVSELH